MCESVRERMARRAAQRGWPSARGPALKTVSEFTRSRADDKAKQNKSTAVQSNVVRIAESLLPCILLHAHGGLRCAGSIILSCLSSHALERLVLPHGVRL